MASFFGGSTTSTTRPIGELFDSGVFSKAGANTETRERALALENILQQSQFSQQPGVLNDLISQLANPQQSLLGDNQRNFILDAAQGQFNKRGIGRLTPNEAVASLAPFELEARQTGNQSLQALTGARGQDLASIMQLILESRPDLLVGSETTQENDPSVISSISSVLSLGKQAKDLGFKSPF